MFLSKLILNIRDLQTRRDLARPYEMHRTLMTSYPYPRVENRCDLLFRVEPSRTGPPVVLVQTREDPDEWPGLPNGYLLGPAESKPLHLPVTVGQGLRFRLRANPAKKVRLIPVGRYDRGTPGRNGKRVGLTTDVEQMRWLLHKGDRGGFKLPGGWVDAKHPETGEPIQLPNFRVDTVVEGHDPNGKPGHAGEFLAVRFDGVLEVTDSEKFLKAVQQGIGPGKAYGFGLLSIAPVRRDS